MNVTLIIPAKNEEAGLITILPTLKQLHGDAEIIVVDDGSSDDTASIAERHGARVLKHPYSIGNGAAIKTGARNANGSILVFMDADGQHSPGDIQLLLAKLDDGYDMAVGARTKDSQASTGRWLVNNIYNKLASWMVGKRISDLTSGFRAVNSHKFREFMKLLPNGFSYPTTITMSFFRAGYTVGYVPVVTNRREGKSHINPIRDGVRFLLIIFRVGTLYSPLKIFFPLAVAHFAVGLSYYLYTYITVDRFTNMSALLLTTSVLIFLIGLVSEQITNLIYMQENKD